MAKILELSDTLAAGVLATDVQELLFKGLRASFKVSEEDKKILGNAKLFLDSFLAGSRFATTRKKPYSALPEKPKEAIQASYLCLRALKSIVEPTTLAADLYVTVSQIKEVLTANEDNGLRQFAIENPEIVMNTLTFFDKLSSFALVKSAEIERAQSSPIPISSGI